MTCSTWTSSCPGPQEPLVAAEAAVEVEAAEEASAEVEEAALEEAEEAEEVEEVASEEAEEVASAEVEEAASEEVEEAVVVSEVAEDATNLSWSKIDPKKISLYWRKAVKINKIMMHAYLLIKALFCIPIEKFNCLWA